jgi:hypothetical protein
MKIRNPDLTRNPVNEEHRQLGLPPIEEIIGAGDPDLALHIPPRDPANTLPVPGKARSEGIGTKVT